MPILSLTDVSLAFGHLPLLDRAALSVEPGERIAVIGRNGTGKSSLLKLLEGSIQADRGSVWRAPGLKSARLDQDVPLVSDRSVFDVVTDGLGDVGNLVRAYHRAARAVAMDADERSMHELGTLQHALDEQNGWRTEQQVELVVERLGLPADQIVDTLSGGWRRRVLLARAIVGTPDLLLLDEPTNHLDIGAIDWLESFLVDYSGTVVFVTHDRTFLGRLATRIVDLDRGRLTSWPGNYDLYLERKEAWLANEAIQHEKFDKKLAEEETWVRQGIKARRTRNEGRVRALQAMRLERAARRGGAGRVNMAIGAADRSGHVVFEADRISYAYGDREVVRDFSVRITRGDRVGLIGPNGAGKTTLLRLLVGSLKPDTGTVDPGTNLQIAYFDQQREQLDPDRTVVDTIADGNDTVVVNGQPRHVHGYLRDFLFPAERARSPVRALSGGERNRLLLARLFTRPANVLVLDEPTNDLDLETLELLESELVAFPGTILIVSHDRAFLDNVVTSVLAFDGEGGIAEYVGGYEDWLRQRSAPIAETPSVQPQERPRAVTRDRSRTAASAKLSFKEQKELETLPSRIDALEKEIRQVESQLASPTFYREGAEALRGAVSRLEVLQAELSQAYGRWEALDARGKAR